MAYKTYYLQSFFIRAALYLNILNYSFYLEPECELDKNNRWERDRE
jgi:hypothetical protein